MHANVFCNIKGFHKGAFLIMDHNQILFNHLVRLPDSVSTIFVFTYFFVNNLSLYIYTDECSTLVYPPI